MRGVAAKRGHLALSVALSAIRLSARCSNCASCASACLAEVLRNVGATRTAAASAEAKSTTGKPRAPALDHPQPWSLGRSSG